MTRKPRSNTGNGLAVRWIKANASHQGNECLTWPFCRSSNGYGSLTCEKKRASAHSFMCEAAHGPAGQEGLVARHTCGNGHLGCVNPNHLAWGTRSQNMQDKIGHGTDNRGTKHIQSKLTEDDVLHIRNLKGVVSEQKIANRYGVGRTTIADVVHKRTWAWL